MSEQNKIDILPKENQETAKDKEKEKEEEIKQIIKWVEQIKDESTREKALEELSHKRESLSDLALYIWYSTGTVSILLQEIINIYQLLAPPKLTIAKSNKACSVLALFQCIAAHPETRLRYGPGILLPGARSDRRQSEKQRKRCDEARGTAV